MGEDANLQDQIISLLANRLNIAGSSATTDLLASGALDSLGIVDLLAEIESRFAVRVPMETLEIDQLRTVETITAMVARLRNGG